VSLAFIGWAVVALVRPQAFYTKTQRELLKSSQLNRPLDWYVGTRHFRVSMRVGGAIALIIGLVLFTLLFHQRTAG